MHFPVEYCALVCKSIDCWINYVAGSHSKYFDSLWEMQPLVKNGSDKKKKHLTFIDSYAHTKRSPHTIISGDDVTPLKKGIFLSILVVFYEKHTGPMFRPNSWSAFPTSMGAKSTTGSLAGVWVLYSITVLPHAPFDVWGKRKPDKSAEASSDRFSPNLSNLRWLTEQPSSTTVYRRRVLPCALSSWPLKPLRTRAFFRLLLFPSLYATLFLQL